MKAYLALIRNDIRLAFRQKAVIFFNFLMPMVLFLIFAQSFHAEQGAMVLQAFTMVTVIGILGNGMMGAGMRTVQDREANILRRYKVAPISPLPVLVGSTITGLVVYIPFVVMMFLLATSRYGMTMPQHPVTVLIFIALGVVAIRAIGLILASVVNSVAEAQVLVQILYLGMLMLSGAAFPLAFFPDWLFNITQFIPSAYLVTGLQGIMIRDESLADNWQATGALLITVVIGMLLAVKLFRWEKEEKIRPAAKLWLLAVLLPFIVLGTWQAHAKQNAVKARILDRQLARSRTLLIRHARIYIGDGRVIENGGVLVKAGKIAEIYESNIPDPNVLHAVAIEGEGKTLLPGLIETSGHLSAVGGGEKTLEQQLAAYLYRGVTAVRSYGDPPDAAAKVKELIDTGQKVGAEYFPATGTAPAKTGHGLRALTLDAAKELHADQRIGSIEKGKDADLLVVDGNPTQDIRALEAISLVIFKGERMNRPDLLKPGD